MSGLFKRLGSLLPARTRKGFAGYDLQGNSYFELPNPAGIADPLGGRMKRSVEYKVSRDVADYTSGKNRLPVQWTTWLSHTRSNPPSIQELQADSSRQSNLRPMVEAIEAREHAERIRQGYISPPGSDQPIPQSIAGPSSPSSYSARSSTPSSSRINTRPSFVIPSQPVPSSKSASATPTPGDASRPDDSPTRANTSRSVPPPPQTVDPLKHDDPAELRRLAEEDTKRRIQQRGGEGDRDLGRREGEKVEGVDVGGSGGLAPRRRGKR